MKKSSAFRSSRRVARLKPLAAALMGMGLTASVLAADFPVNLNCVRGSCNTITTTGNTMTMGQTSRIAVYESTDFGLAAGNTLRNTGSGMTIVRVVPADGLFGVRSLVNGTVTSDPSFVLINPWGISVGGSITSTTGSVLLSARDLDASLTTENYDALFNGAHLVFNTSGYGGYGDVQVYGEARLTAQGGSVFLVGDAVNNSGVIRAAQGQQVMLLAADTAEVAVGDSGFISLVAASAPTGDNMGRSVYNDGLLRAEGGSIKLAAYGNSAFVENTGVIDASSAVGAGGTVRMEAKADSAAQVTNYGQVLATSAAGRGGEIQLVAEDAKSSQVRQGGYVDASSSVGVGGAITLSARDVYAELCECQYTPTFVATGATGGGTIELNNATVKGQGNSSIRVDANAEFDVSAMTQGNGGTIRISSLAGLAIDYLASNANVGDVTVFGRLVARGAGAGGNGGSVETSGSQVTTRYGEDRIRIDVSGGPGGAGGIWSMYASGLTVGHTVLGPDVAFPGTYVYDGDINTVLNQGGKVSLTTSYEGHASIGGGDLTVESGTLIQRTAGTGTGALLLQSGRDVIFQEDSTITSSSGKLDVLVRADADGNGVGSVRLEGFRQTANNTTLSGQVRPQAEGDAPVTIETNGGNLSLIGAVMPDVERPAATEFAGVDISGAILNTKGSDGSVGDILIKGFGGGRPGGEGQGNAGVWIGSSDISGGYVSIMGYALDNTGVYITDTTLTTANQTISVNGWANGGNFGQPVGVMLDYGTVFNLGQGNARVVGRAEGTDAVGVQVYDLLLTTSPPAAGVTPTVLIAGESVGSSQPGVLFAGDGVRMQAEGNPAIAASADVIVGGSADTGLAAKAMDLGSPDWNTTGRINFRPLGVSFDGEQLNVVEKLGTAIQVGAGPNAAGSNFIVDPVWFVPAGATASAPALTKVVVGSSGHTGQITVEDGALTGAGPVTLQNQGEGSQGIVLGAQDNPNQTLNLLSTGSVTQTGALAISTLNVIAMPANVVLNNPANRIRALAFNGAQGATIASVATPSASGATGVLGFSTATNSFQLLDITYGPNRDVPDVERPILPFEGPDALNDLRTDVYVRGQFSRPQICTPANTSGGAVLGMGEVEPLSQEWTKVRRGAQLTNCSTIQADSNCSAF